MEDKLEFRITNIRVARGLDASKNTLTAIELESEIEVVLRVPNPYTITREDLKVKLSEAYYKILGSTSEPRNQVGDVV